MQVNECVQGIFSLCYSFHLSIYLLILATKFARPGPMKWKHWVLTTVVAQLVKNLPVMQETWVWSLGWEDHLEEMQPTPVLLPGEFHGQRSQAGYSPWDCRVRHDWVTNLLNSIDSQIYWREMYTGKSHVVSSQSLQC